MLRDHIIAADWPAPANVSACTTLRGGGASRAPFDSFNLAAHVGDDPRDVERNRAALREALTLPREPAWLEQRHGSGVVAVDHPARGARAADAAIAHAPGHVCAVLTADCLPVLICDAGGTRIAAVHAGWRGLAAGVIAAAIGRLDAGGRRLLAWLGPAIGPEAYEVDEPVRTRLLAACPQAQDAFTPVRPGHWHADLYGVARHQLGQAGVDAVWGGDFCTYSDRRFFSHRRDGLCGRQASLIWLS